MATINLTGTPPEVLAADLRVMADFIAEHGRKIEGYEYTSMYDFVAREGKLYEAVGHGFDMLTPKCCFDNSIEMAQEYGFPYVEGYAYSSHGLGLAVHHAWNLDEQGRVIDVTWQDWETGVQQPGVAYLGVEIPVEAAEWPREYECTAIDNWRFDFPLLREKWRGPDHCPLEEPEGD